MRGWRKHRVKGYTKNTPTATYCHLQSLYPSPRRVNAAAHPQYMIYVRREKKKHSKEKEREKKTQGRKEDRENKQYERINTEYKN